jgi:hypothetical protein
LHLDAAFIIIYIVFIIYLYILYIIIYNIYNEIHIHQMNTIKEHLF